jgi:hypothetical protein
MFNDLFGPYEGIGDDVAQKGIHIHALLDIQRYSQCHW